MKESLLNYHWSPVHQPDWLERIIVTVGLSTVDSGSGIYGYEVYRVNHTNSIEGSRTKLKKNKASFTSWLRTVMVKEHGTSLMLFHLLKHVPFH